MIQPVTSVTIPMGDNLWRIRVYDLTAIDQAQVHETIEQIRQDNLALDWLPTCTEQIPPLVRQTQLQMGNEALHKYTDPYHPEYFLEYHILTVVAWRPTKES